MARKRKRRRDAEIMAPKHKCKQPDDAETTPSKRSKAPDDAESTPRKKLNHKMPVPLAGFDEMGRKLLCSLGFPVAFWKLLEILMTLVPIIPDLDFVEFFCGAKAVTFALERLGLRGLGYDKIHDRSHQNMMSGLGFCCALCWLLRVTPDDGFVWLDTLCSSWIWLSRGTTRRTRALPRGDQSSSAVVTGNACSTLRYHHCHLLRSRFVMGARAAGLFAHEATPGDGLRAAMHASSSSNMVANHNLHGSI